MAELLTFSRRSLLRLLPILCFLLIPSFGLAQTAVNYCEPPAAVKAELEKVTKINESDQPFKTQQQQQLAMLQELVKKYPTDLHVRRRYQDIRRSGFKVDWEPLLADYRMQMEQHSSDPVATYLYARLLVGRETKKAITLATELTKSAPEFPWTYLQLAEIYTYQNFRDAAKSTDYLKQWTAKCPGILAGFRMISRTGDKEFMTSASRSLRSRLESSMVNEDLLYWDDLWTLEFKLKPVNEHAEVRKQIAEDVKRLRAANLNTSEWLETLRAGYKQLGDKTNERWAEDELVRLKPNSYAARRFAQSRFYDQHPFPKGEATPGERQAYQRALAQVASEWIKRWPDDEGLWSTRVRSLTALDDATNAEVEAAYNGYAKAHEQAGNSYLLPPIEIAVARVYLQRGFHLQAVPTLLEKGIAEIEQIEKSNGPSDLFKRNEDLEESNVKYVRMEGWPLLAEAYARVKQPEKAQVVLAQLADIVKPPKVENDAQKRSFAYGQTIYWQAAGKVAEAEQRKLDALTAYQTAIAFRLDPVTQGKKDELTDNAKRLWQSLGGTDQGWRAYLARTDNPKNKLESAELASWDSKNTALPEFELTDLEGRKWSLADLKGKVAFINLWATWCGPCRAELPYVQKLREQLKGKSDVLVLTLNTDDELGMVEPFMKENKYSFPVLLGQAYAEGQGVNSIPRNWIVSQDGKIMFEGIGFANDGEEWIKRAVNLIEKVKAMP